MEAFSLARRRTPVNGVSAALIVALSLAAAKPAWAAGSNSGTPNPTPVTPTPVVTSTEIANPVVGGGGCSQQYLPGLGRAVNKVLTANDAGIALNATGAAATVVGLAAQGVTQAAAAVSFGVIAGGLAEAAVGVVTPLDAGPAAPGLAAAGIAAGVLAGDSTAATVATTAAGIGAAAAVSGIATQLTGTVFAHQAQDLTDYANTLDFCDSKFTGTVTVKAGGVDVTGDSIFRGNVGLGSSLNVAGGVTASTLSATQGISAFGGAITIGDPNLTTYSSGITLGGGALSGAGTGGAQAVTGDVTAVAIGNNAQATQVGSLALGTDAAATGLN